MISVKIKERTAEICSIFWMGVPGTLCAWFPPNDLLLFSISCANFSSLHCVIHTSSVQIEPRLNCPQLHLVIQRPLRVLCYTAGRDVIDCTDIHAGTDAA